MKSLFTIVLVFSSVATLRSQMRIESADPAPGDSSAPATMGAVNSPSDVAGGSSTLKTALYTGGAVAITAGLIRYDQQTYAVLDRWRRHSSSIGRVSPLITNLGNGVASVGLFGGYLGYGLIVKNNRAINVGKIGLESFIVSGVAVQALKYLFGREEPSVATKPGGKWSGPFSYFKRNRSGLLGIGSFDAFPSGHTATIFAAAATLADSYESPWVSYSSYGVASGVAISRIMERTHWLSDVFVGAVIGVLSTKAVEKLNELPVSATVAPIGSTDMVGVQLVLQR